MIKFKETILISFYKKGKNFTVYVDGKKEPIILRNSSETFKKIADLLDKYVTEKIVIVEELSRIDHSSIGFTPMEERYILEEGVTVNVLLIKDERVKSLSNMQDLPKRLLEVLPDEVIKEMRPTSKQVGMIKWLEEEVEPPEFRRKTWEIMRYTKREASAVIKVLLDRKEWYDRLVEESKKKRLESESSTTSST